MTRVKAFKFIEEDDRESREQALEITTLSNDITSLIRQSDLHLKQLGDFEQNHDKVDKEIRKNI